MSSSTLNLDSILNISAECSVDIAKGRFDSYVERIGAIIIDESKYVDLRIILDNYFNSKPPFAITGKKKHEFPDAIALKAIENWSIKTSTKSILVSNDADWGGYCKSINSEYLKYSDDLEKVIANITEDIDNTPIADHVRKALDDKNSDLYLSIKDIAEQYVFGLDIDPKYYSIIGFELDELSKTLIDFEFTNDKNHGDVFIVDHDDESIGLLLSLNMNISVAGFFNLSYTDARGETSIIDEINLKEYDSIDDSFYIDLIINSKDGSIIVKDYDIPYRNALVVDFDLIE